MAILDIFKKKPRKAPSVPRRKKPKEAEKEKSAIVKGEVRTEAPRPKTKISGIAYRILKTPQITEKATDLVEKNQYAFRIFPGANKIEVKKAIEAAFGVNVVSVKIINVHKKKRRFGRIRGIKPGYKKAIVKIKKGQKIELLLR